uniref:Uncharacterized protein n=1 Tax=Megaselia scalaris TaxID=36166 RepID=T1GNJ4_MEGSC
MSNVNLENLDKLGNSSLLKVDFSHNKISKIPLETFDDLVKLKFLDIGYNIISVLQGSEFKHLTSLTELRLNFNQLKEIPSNCFDGLANLQNLDLSYNYLELIDGFEYLTNLQKLSLQGNELKTVPSNLALPNSLRFLDVSKNPLTFLGQNTFRNLNQLTSLDISSTNGTYINFGRECLRPLTSLKSLKFTNNQLSNLEDLYLPGSLEELSLEFNKILKITSKGVENLVNLKYLNLSYNHMYYFEDGVMEQLSNIRKLDLSGNDL